MTSDRAPSLFISHGAPTFAIEPSVIGPKLCAIGARLGSVKSFLIASPHWQTGSSIEVACAARMEAIHDFGGFPEELYQISYSPKGDPEAAELALEALSKAGFPVGLDGSRGLDHGAWVPMLHMRPGADVPAFQVSMPVGLGAAQAFEVGRALAPLRGRGIAIVGSGSMTHNLREFFRGDGGLQAYAGEFAKWVERAVMSGDFESLIDYRRLAPNAARAHPTEEHFLPLLIAMGAALPGEAPAFIEGGIDQGSLSMDSYAWGL